MPNTVIAIRQSGGTGNTPSLGVLANGEVALNYADGILYYKTTANTLGSIRTTQPSGLNQEVQFNDSGSFGGNSAFTFNKSLATLNVTNINTSSLITGGGSGGIISGANVIYSNTFVANTGGITTTGNSTLNGIITVNYINATSVPNAAIEMYGANTKGGTGYFDFIAANNRSTGTTNPNKFFRIDSNGAFQIINSAYTNNLFNLNDSGYLTVPGGITTSQYIQFSDGSRQYTANASLSNNQILAGLQTVSPTANITFDSMILANNNNGRNLRIGDDAWIGDVNLADTISIRGAFNAANGYISFGNNDGIVLGRAGSGPLTYGGGIATSQFIQFADGSKQYTANAGGGSSSSANSFGQIVANGGTILATTSNDSLQIVGESGITVTSNISAKKVVVSVPAGYTFTSADYGFVYEDTNVIYDYGTL